MMGILKQTLSKIYYNSFMAVKTENLMKLNMFLEFIPKIMSIYKYKPQQIYGDNFVV